MLKKDEKDKRFEVIFAEGSSLSESGRKQILVDKKTGVHYLSWQSGYAGGITPLLDNEGNVVTKGKLNY